MRDWEIGNIFVITPAPRRCDSSRHPLIADLYERHGAGGKCHIVTDDFNVRDSDIWYCQGLDTDELETAVLDLLDPLTESERWAIVTQGTYAEGEEYEPWDD